jgi:predicted anti-sigma-YlaC factor YlaD
MCPDREILSAYLDGEIGAPWNRAIAEHVASCRRCQEQFARLEQTRRVLQEEPLLDWEEPMERVRRAIISRVPPVRGMAPVWRRHVLVPMPIAAFAAILVLGLGIALAVSLGRANIGFVRITKAPAGGTEYQFAIPADKVEALLKSVGGGDSSTESVMTLPKHVRLIPVGEPRMGRAAEFPRVKP